MRQSQVKEVVQGSQYYILLPIDNKWDRLLRVIATNETHILSVYRYALHTETGSQIDPTYYLYVHDKATKKIVGRKVKYFDWDKDYKDIIKPIEKYFYNCHGLIEKIKANAAEQHELKRLARGGPFVGISNTTCGSN